MQKKYLTGVLVFALSCSLLLSGCGGTPKTTEEKTSSQTPTETNALTEIKTEAETNAPTETEAETTAQFIAETPYSTHGKLSVSGTDLVDKSGEKFQLYGMSTHGISWFPKFVSKETFQFLRDDWNTNCIRLAMYTAESGGYCTEGDKEYIKTLVKNGVDYATELDMYVIIDWHVLNDKNPLLYKDEAIAFFEEISALYADYDNVVYEICNEPNSSAPWSDITAYANDVIPVIRANNSNAVIIVGTPTWSQDIDKALAQPLEFDNIMYALHFYAGTHKDWLRDRMENCIKQGLPVFISEFGICDASGNGALDYNSAEAWKSLIEEYNVSYFCWNLANKNESSSIVKQDCDKLSGWTDDDLNDQGIWIREWFLSEK